MKKLIFLIIPILLLFIQGCENSKESPIEGNEPENPEYPLEEDRYPLILDKDIYLGDLHIDSVKNAIIGKWQLISSYNGFAGIEKEYENTIWYLGTDSLKITNDEGIITNKSIRWKKKILGYDDSYRLNVINYDPQSDDEHINLGDIMICDYINQTLRLSESFIDGDTYYLKKYNE